MPQITMGYTTLYAEPLETVSAAAAGGFKSVGLRITGRRPSEPYAEVIGNAAAIRAIRERLERTGIGLSNVSTYHFHPELRLDDVIPVIEATAELGAKTMVASCYDPDRLRYVDFLARCCAAAAPYCIRWALEFIPYSEAKTIGQALSLAESTGAPNIGVLIDALHLDRSGGKPSDLSGIDPDRISFFQICDAPSERPHSAEALRQEAITGRLYPGDGNLPLHALLDALPPDIEIECEFPNAAFSSLPLDERARRAHEAICRFLEDHARQKEIR